MNPCSIVLTRINGVQPLNSSQNRIQRFCIFGYTISKITFACLSHCSHRGSPVKLNHCLFPIGIDYRQHSHSRLSGCRSGAKGTSEIQTVVTCYSTSLVSRRERTAIECRTREVFLNGLATIIQIPAIHSVIRRRSTNHFTTEIVLIRHIV